MLFRERVPRRAAFARLAAAATFCGLSPDRLLAGDKKGTPRLPDPAASNYWNQLRAEQFLLPNDRAFLNNGSLGVAPRRVVEAVCRELELGAEYASDEAPRWGYEQLEAERAEMAAFLGCAKEEIAFTHNCTEGMNFIANGLDLGANDEVVMTNQEHPGGSSCWRLKAARYGVKLREVELPVPPRDPSEFTERLIGAISPQTRVLSFSGIISGTGMRLPVAEICAAARARNVITVVDGAHMNGQVPVDLASLGCDYFAGSPHKWLFAPAGCGILYGRAGRLDELWSTIASAGWEKGRGTGSSRFLMVGTNSRVSIAGMLAGMRFHRELGSERIFARLRELTDHVRQLVSQRSYIEVITPPDHRLHQGMILVQFKTEKTQPAFDALRAAKILVLGGHRLRLSCHVHTRIEDLDRCFAVLDRAMGQPA